MQVHNFFHDLLLTIPTMFENYIFDTKNSFYDTIIEKEPKRFIQNWEYNIANRSYQLFNYKESAQVSFPNAIVRLGQDENAFGKTGGIIQHHRIMDINEVPVLYNIDTKKTIYLREDQTRLNISLQINCESQLQAKEIEHQIKRYLPINKYIQFIEFTSFLELPQLFIDKLDMNPNLHDIINLYEKLDPTTGHAIYCFGIGYKPHIRLDNCTAQIDDISARSWQVTCDFTYHIQLPMWLFSDKDPEIPAKINFTFALGKFEPISDISQDSSPIILKNTNYIAKRNFIIYEEETKPYINIINKKVVIEFKFNEKDFKFTGEPIQINKGKKTNSFFSNLDSNKYFYDEENNKIQIELDLDYWNANFKPELTSPLIIKFLKQKKN